MIEFIAGICVGYFCRPVVAVVITAITDVWQKYQQNKPTDTNIPK